MLYGAQNGKVSSRAIPMLLAVLLACAFLLASPLLAQADEAAGTTGSQGPNLMFAQHNDIYVGGNGGYSTIEEAINAVPDGESRTIRVKAGTYSGFKINRNVNIKLVPDGGNVVFQTKQIELDNEASLALEGNSSNYFVMEKGANLANGSTLDLFYCRAEGPIQANNSNLEMRMSNMDDPASPLIGGRPNGSIGLFNSSRATIAGTRILGTVVVSDSVIEEMNRVTVNSQMGRGAIAITVKDSGRVERIFNSSILANPNAISLLDGSMDSIECTNLYVSFDDAKASAIVLKGPSSIDLVKECMIEAKRAFEFTASASSDAAAPKVGAVEGTTVYGNDKSIASTADAQAQVVLEPSLVGSGKAIGAGNYHDKHGEYDEWTAISAPEGYRLSRMTRTLNASDVPDSFKDVGYRYFVAVDCRLTFNSNHGEGDMSAYNLPRGSEEVWADLPYTIPACKFTYDGHKFKAWNTKPDGTGTSFLPGSNVFIFKTLNQKDVTLYAIYEGTLITVTFDYGGESGLERQGVWKGNKATKPDDPQRDHYDFGGWYTDAACTERFDFDTPINSDLTLYAKWENFSSHHNWIEEKREGEANCVSGMHVTYRCTLCNETKVEYTPPNLSIHHTEWLTNQDRHEATCTQDGYYYDVEKCKDCGFVLRRRPTIISKTGHSWGAWTVKTPSTEWKAGVQQHICTKCGATEERPYPTVLHSHTLEKIAKVDSTCESQGHVEYWYCTGDNGCGGWFIEKNGHMSEIGPDDVIALPLADHTPGNPVTVNVVMPTCGANGSHDEVVYCTVCGKELRRYRVVDLATGQHTEGEPKTENVIASTCAEHGSHEEAVYCTVCNKELSRVFVDDDLLPHTPGEPVREDVVDPTTNEDGWYDEVVYCTECGHEISRREQPLPAYGASYSIVKGNGAEWPSGEDGAGLTQVFKRSEYDETTLEHFLAIRIDNADTLLDPSNYRVEKGSVIVTLEPDYLRTLSVGKHTATALFDDGDAVTGTFFVADCPHKDCQHIDRVESTCHSNGNIEYWYCRDCCERLVEEDGALRPIEGTDEIALPLANHTLGEPVREHEKASTCTDRGSHQEAVYCTVCNKELSREFVEDDLLPHTPGEPVRENEKASTCTERGSHEEAVYCAVCEQELSREHVDDGLLPHTPGEPVRENVVDPTATEDGRYDEVVYCETCGLELSRKEVDLPAGGASYSIVEGDGDEWSDDDDAGLTLVFKRSEDDDTAFDHFLGIKVDNSDSLLDPSNYLAERGSVVVTLLPDYLRTLEVGEHTVTALFDDGNDVEATISITEPKEEAAGDPVQPEEAKSSSVKPTSSTTSPKTGDDQRAIIIVFAALAFASLVIVLIARRKRRNQ